MSQNVSTNFQQRTNTTKNTTNATSGRHGKSKYAQKKHQKKNYGPAKVKQGPVFEYACVCHGEAAKKPELVKVRPAPKSPEETKGLGHWRCSVNGKHCGVTVRKAQPKMQEVVVGQPSDVQQS